MEATKLFTVLFAALFLSLAMVSALTLTTDPATLTISASDTSKSFIVNGDSAFDILPMPSIATINGTTFVITNTTSMLNVTSATFTVTPTFPTTFTFGNTGTGTLTINAINVSDSVAASKTSTVTIENNNQCTGSNPLGLTVTDIEFNVLKGLGDDEDYWYPLDEIEVSFTVENPSASDIKDIEITACLRDMTANKCVMDEDDMDLSDDSFDVDSDDDYDVTLTFTLDPDFLKSGNTNYRLYVSANGEVDDSDSAYDGDSTCTTDYQEIEIRTDEQFIVVTNIEVPESVKYDSEFDFNAEVWNIGDESIDQDEIFVRIFSFELGIDQVITLNDDLGDFEKESISAILKVTKPVADKTYQLKVIVYDDEDMGDNDVYTNSEDDDASYTILLKVAGSADKAATITATLSESTPKTVAGSQTIIETTIINTGKTATTYTVEVSGNSAWSKATVDPSSSFTLNVGESKDVKVYLDVNADATAGEKEFTIKANYGTGAVEQKVKLTVEKGFTAQALVNHFKTNWYIYAIVLVNLILIIAIVLVVRSLVRKN